MIPIIISGIQNLIYGNTNKIVNKQTCETFLNAFVTLNKEQLQSLFHPNITLLLTFDYNTSYTETKGSEDVLQEILSRFSTVKGMLERPGIEKIYGCDTMEPITFPMLEMSINGQEPDWIEFIMSISLVYVEGKTLIDNLKIRPRPPLRTA